MSAGPPMTKIDKAAYQKRLDRITEIFADMVTHADVSARHRCPYRNRFDQCTAEFKCRAQRPPKATGEPAQCGHDGRFDYRSAWQSDPSSYRRAKEKIEKIKDRRGRRQGRTRPGKADP